MKIGIDARFVGPQGTGLGKYTEKLIENLAQIDSRNRYAIFLRKTNWNYLSLPRHRNFTKILADIPWYSLSEQIKMPKIFTDKKFDILHVPHFNVPIFYKGKFIVTIHDLIHHHFQEQSVTTKNPLIFKVKRLGYRIVVNHAIQKSAKIIVPSNFVKKEIIKNFKVDSSKVVVTYEAAEEEYFKGQLSNVKGQLSPYLIYVGNAYPHKNLERLLDAFKIVNGKWKMENGKLKLVIVCPRDIFSNRLQSEVQSRGLGENVEIKGYMKAGELAKLFHQATAYVFPSLSEGFGIPGLNAMAAGIAVVCSDIPTLKEIYGDAVLYFDPTDPKDIAEKIKKVLTNTTTRSDLVVKGQAQVQKYSWLQMAKETLKVYENI